MHQWKLVCFQRLSLKRGFGGCGYGFGGCDGFSGFGSFSRFNRFGGFRSNPDFNPHLNSLSYF